MIAKTAGPHMVAYTVPMVLPLDMADTKVIASWLHMSPALLLLLLCNNES